MFHSLVVLIREINKLCLFGQTWIQKNDCWSAQRTGSIVNPHFLSVAQGSVAGDKGPEGDQRDAKETP
jgi:hypothetical protein